MNHHFRPLSQLNLCLILLLLLPLVVHACKCIPSTPEQTVCTSDISIHGRVVAEYDNCVGRCNESILDSSTSFAADFIPRATYIVRVITSFRGDKFKGDVLYLTSLLFTSCTVALEIDSDYLFNIDTKFGNFDNFSCPAQTFPVNLCSGTKNWNILTKEFRSFLKQVKVGNLSRCE